MVPLGWRGLLVFRNDIGFGKTGIRTAWGELARLTAFSMSLFTVFLLGSLSYSRKRSLRLLCSATLLFLVYFPRHDVLQWRKPLLLILSVVGGAIQNAMYSKYIAWSICDPKKRGVGPIILGGTTRKTRTFRPSRSEGSWLSQLQLGEAWSSWSGLQCDTLPDYGLQTDLRATCCS